MTNNTNHRHEFHSVDKSVEVTNQDWRPFPLEYLHQVVWAEADALSAVLCFPPWWLTAA
ncbi:MAG TPA: hypothetical protein QF695_00705 [Arenicellales bacterium]|jgi:hypothetical protein|nr:hypothetical protein [Arenicellales bacterium]